MNLGDDKFDQHNIKSYRLVLVNPDDLNTNKAFENLVSQPIALTIPLMEQQLAASGTNKLPPPQEWWSYRATNTDAMKLAGKSSKEFADWRQALHDQDLAVPHLPQNFAIFFSEFPQFSQKLLSGSFVSTGFGLATYSGKGDVLLVFFVSCLVLAISCNTSSYLLIRSSFFAIKSWSRASA